MMYVNAGDERYYKRMEHNYYYSYSKCGGDSIEVIWQT
jgi:hypothetical protein